MAILREIFFYKDHFGNFYEKQNQKAQEKIQYILDILRYESRVPVRFLKRLEGTDGIYEIRVITAFASIRILCFFDKEDIVVLINSFVKKARKIPKKEINLAERLKREYIIERYGES